MPPTPKFYKEASLKIESNDIVDIQSETALESNFSFKNHTSCSQISIFHQKGKEGTKFKNKRMAK